MEISETIACPYCGQRQDLVLDTSIPDQQFTSDCEVCCRPFEVRAACEPGEVIQLEVVS
ncbi:MAG: CPXCG motif-containing cysteine-rich protein [Verrucomicrobiae bacterium]|nr:CPXCG motif-containing cysteine-rich protein [Verrucomicrobiae bacterium]